MFQTEATSRIKSYMHERDSLLSEGVFILSSFLKNIVMNIEFWVESDYFPSNLKMLFSCLLTFIVSEEKSIVI